MNGLSFLIVIVPCARRIVTVTDRWFMKEKKLDSCMNQFSITTLFVCVLSPSCLDDCTMFNDPGGGAGAVITAP